jgi:hypothetical protein
VTGSPAGSPSCLSVHREQDVGIGHVHEHVIHFPDSPRTERLPHVHKPKKSQIASHLPFASSGAWAPADTSIC